MARDMMYEFVVEHVTNFKEELTTFLNWTTGEVDSWYLTLLLNAYMYDTDQLNKKGVWANSGLGEDSYDAFCERFMAYMTDLSDLSTEIRRVQSSGEGDGSDKVEAFLGEVSVRKNDFEYPEEYALYMRTFLGNAGFRESVVRKRRVKLWRMEFNSFREDHFDRLDYVLMMNLITEVEKCLVWNRNLMNESESVYTWAFRSMMSSDPVRYAKKKTEYLKVLTEQADFLIEMFSKDRV